MTLDTRPALTARWRELERRGASFWVHAHNWSVQVGCEYNGKSARTTAVAYPVREESEESILKGMEYWMSRVDKGTV